MSNCGAKIIENVFNFRIISSIMIEMKSLIRQLEWDKFKIYLINNKDIECITYRPYSYAARFKLITTYFSEVEFTERNFDYFINELRLGNLTDGKALKRDTINMYIRMAKYIAEYLDLDFLKTRKNLKNKTEMDQVQSHNLILTKKEMRMIAECSLKRYRAERETNRRYKAIIMTLIYTGMRPNELCSLTWNDYDGDYFYIRTSKTGKAREVPVSPQLQIIINKLIKYKHNYIFGGLYSKLKPQTINDELKLRASYLGFTKPCNAYVFRHSFITHMLLDYGDSILSRLAMICGNSVKTIFKYYLHLQNKHLKKLIDGYDPFDVRKANLDTTHRKAESVLSDIIDTNYFSYQLTIQRKNKEIRHVSMC